MNKEFIQAIEDLEKERHIPKDVLIEAIESALVSAYKKNYGTSQNVRVDINEETGDINVYMRMDIVDEVEDEFTQISLDEARDIDYRYEVGDVVEYQVTPRDFGRIAAQTAKQVVVQRIREAERGMIFDDYITRQGEIVTGTVQRISNETLFINIGRTEGILSDPGAAVHAVVHQQPIVLHHALEGLRRGVGFACAAGAAIVAAAVVSAFAAAGRQRQTQGGGQGKGQILFPVFHHCSLQF